MKTNTLKKYKQLNGTESKWEKVILSSSIVQQCEILDISRLSYYYQPKEVPGTLDFSVLEARKEKSFYGYRRIVRELYYVVVTRK
ncbi:hypothetical protein [Macellibacteroides fermentans]|uniref:hypothetical protein n=1 Tax=Macellibacteroides fermentans TaxID=879969 RepID=UPI00406C54F8